MSVFKRGDRLRVLFGYTNDRGAHLRDGEIVTVSIPASADNHALQVEGDERHWWNEDRFELVTPAAAVQATKILDGATVSTDSVSEAGEDGWWDVVPTPRMEDGLAVTRGWAGALGLEVRVQVRRAVS